jgi:predicted RNA-binding protein YlxR (DUF448 family)
LRFVVAPDGALVHDITGKLPGRGMYLALDKNLLTEAIERKSFSRSSKRAVYVSEGFESLVESQLEERVLQALSLARKAGQALCGFDKCMEATRAEDVLCMLHARDAASDGVRKLTPMKSDGNPCFSSTLYFTRDALSRVMGAENVVHVAVLEGQAGQFFLTQLRRFALFIEKTPL